MATEGIEYGMQLIQRTLTKYFDSKFNTPKAVLQLAATGLQESKFKDRVQLGGPAHSFWQMEKGGGVHGALTSDVTRSYAVELCAHFNIAVDEDAVYNAIQLPEYDELACGLARLIYYADPQALPEIGDVDGSWRCYIRNWRPGKPRPVTWPGNYATAKELLDVS